jgi:hypothetical protein
MLVSMGLELGMLDGNSDINVGALLHEQDHDKYIPRLSAT